MATMERPRPRAKKKKKQQVVVESDEEVDEVAAPAPAPPPVAVEPVVTVAAPVAPMESVKEPTVVATLVEEEPAVTVEAPPPVAVVEPAAPVVAPVVVPVEPVVVPDYLLRRPENRYSDVAYPSLDSPMAVAAPVVVEAPAEEIREATPPPRVATPPPVVVASPAVESVHAPPAIVVPVAQPVLAEPVAPPVIVEPARSAVAPPLVDMDVVDPPPAYDYPAETIAMGPPIVAMAPPMVAVAPPAVFIPAPVVVDAQPMMAAPMMAAPMVVAPPMAHPMMAPPLMEEDGVVGMRAELESVPAYYNPQLEGAEEMVNQFQQRLQQIRSPFYELVAAFLYGSRRADASWENVQEYQSASTTQADKIWATRQEVQHASGRCRDNHQMSVPIHFEVAVFSQEHLMAMADILRKLRLECDGTLTLAVYEARLARMRVEAVLHDFLTTAPLFRLLNSSSPVTAGPPWTGEFARDMEAIKHFTDVLFHFEKESSSGKGAYVVQFTGAVREWLRLLAGAMVRAASFYDHRFLLYHLARCPGIGAWGADMLQFPSAPWTQDVVDYFVATLYVLLRPVSSGAVVAAGGPMPTGVIKDLLPPPPSPAMKDEWVLLDDIKAAPPPGTTTDSIFGEGASTAESGLVLSEDDFLALFEQFPFGTLFQHLVSQRPSGAAFGHYTLAVFSVCNFLLHLLCSTFNQTKPYGHFIKRIGNEAANLVRFLEAYRNVNLADWSPALQGEFDRFFERTVVLFMSHGRAVYQFLPALPVRCISPRVAHQTFLAYYFASSPDETEMKKVWKALRADDWLSIANVNPGIRDAFCNTLRGDPAGEFVLGAMANLAESHGIELATIIVHEIFYVAYVNENMRVVYGKPSRELVAVVTQAHPTIITHLLSLVLTHFPLVGSVALFLFRALPLDTWLPSVRDFDIVHGWLMASLETPQSTLAQYILKSLNWGVSHSDVSQPPLVVLGLDVHRQTALRVGEAYARHLVVQAQTLFQGYSRKVRADFNKWVWEMFGKLRISTMGYRDQSFRPMLVDSDPALFWMRDVITKVKTTRDPVVTFLQNELTTIGYNNEAMQGENVRGVVALVGGHLVGPALRLMHDVLLRADHLSLSQPSYADIGQMLYVIRTSDARQEAGWRLQEITTPPGAPDAVYVRNLASLILAQLFVASNPHRTVASNVDSLVNFWLTALFDTKAWHLDPNQRYLVDVISQGCFLVGSHEPLQMSLRREHDVLLAKVPGAGTRISNFFQSLITGKEIKPSLLDLPTSVTTLFMGTPVELGNPWFVFDVLYCETLHSAEARTAMCQALVDTPSLSFPAMLTRLTLSRFIDNFSIYRWATYMLAMPVAAAPLPIYCQIFFTLYFAAATPNAGTEGAHRATPPLVPQIVGMRFFEDGSPKADIKRALMQRCRDASQHHANLATAGTPGKHTELAQLYSAMALWLDAPDPDALWRQLQTGQLPEHLCPARFASVMTEDPLTYRAVLWSDLVDTARMREELLEMARPYLAQSPDVYAAVYMSPTLFRVAARRQRRGRRRGAAAAGEEDIYETLQAISGSRQISAPLVQIGAAVTNAVDLVSGTAIDTVERIVVEMQPLVRAAEVFRERSFTFDRVDNEYLSMFPNLYVNEQRTQTVTLACHERGGPQKVCTGPAMVPVYHAERRLVQQVQDHMTRNRAHHASFITSAGADAVLCGAALRTLRAAEALVTAKEHGGLDRHRVQEIGNRLLYRLIESLNPVTDCYPASKSLLYTAVRILGAHFISEDGKETVSLLTAMVKNPACMPLLTPIFEPKKAPVHMVDMYEMAVNACKGFGPALGLPLLLRFDIADWLRSAPSRDVRSRLLSLLCLNIAQIDDMMQPVLPIRDFHRRQFALVAAHEFPTHFFDALKLLMSYPTANRITIGVWQDLLALNLNTLPLSHVFGALDEMKDFLWGARRGKIVNPAAPMAPADPDAWRQAGAPAVSLFVVWGAYVDAWTEVVKRLLTSNSILNESSAYAAFSSVDMVSVWRQLTKVMDPWVVTMTELARPHAAGAPPATYPPWFFPENAEPALKLFKAVVELGSLFAARDHRILTEVWHWYNANLLPDAAPYVLELVHSQLPSLPWQMWELDVPMLTIIARVAASPSPAGIMLLYLLPRVDWVALRASWPVDPGTPSLEELLLRTSLSLVRRATLPVPNIFVSFVEDVLPRLSWSTFPAPLFEAVIKDGSLVAQSAPCPVTSTILPPPASADGPRVTSEEGRLQLMLSVLRGATGLATLTKESGPVVPGISERVRIWIQHVISLALTPPAPGAPPRFDAAAHRRVLEELLVEASTLHRLGGASLHPEAMIAVLQEVLNVVNATRLEDVDTSLRHFAEWLGSPAGAALALLLVTACYRIVTFPRSRSLLGEMAIACAVKHTMPVDWATVARYLELREFTEDDDLKQVAKVEGCITLYAATLQKLQRVRDVRELRNIVSVIALWLREMGPMEGTGAFTENVLLLWHRYAEIVELQLARPEAISAVDVANDYRALATHLTTFAQEKSTGFFAALGFGAEDPMSPPIRIAARALAAFIAIQAGQAGDDPRPLRTDPSVPVTASKSSTKLVTAFRELAKKYNAFKVPITTLADAMIAPSETAATTTRFINLIAISLFPDRPHLFQTAPPV